MSTTKASKDKLSVAERRSMAIQMRRAGASYREIGKKLGISHQAAYKLVATALKSFQSEAVENLDAIRLLELERLDHWLLLVNKEISSGKVLAGIDRGLRIMERRAKLLGLDAEKSIELQVASEKWVNYEDYLKDMTNEELLMVLDGKWDPLNMTAKRKRKPSAS